MATLIRNVSLGPFTFPPPYRGEIDAGAAGICADSVATITAAIGEKPGVLRFEEIADGSTATIRLATSADVPDGSIGTVDLADLAVTTGKLAANAVTTAKITDANVTTAKVADAAITKGKALVFVSGQIVGNGAPQNAAHGLAAVPSVVMISLVGGPAVYAAPVVTPGAHTNVNVIATVTADWTYQIFAWA